MNLKKLIHCFIYYGYDKDLKVSQWAKVMFMNITTLLGMTNVSFQIVFLLFVDYQLSVWIIIICSFGTFGIILAYRQMRKKSYSKALLTFLVSQVLIIDFIGLLIFGNQVNFEYCLLILAPTVSVCFSQEERRYAFITALVLVISFVGLNVMENPVLTAGSPLYQQPAAMSIIKGMNLLTILLMILLTHRITERMLESHERRLYSAYYQAKNLADYDHLTGLYNRRSLTEIIKQQLNEQKAISLAMCDIDFFKEINDRYGHPVGDKVLIELAGIFERRLPDAWVGRWGGEEFVFVFPEARDKDFFLAKLEEVRTWVERYSFPKGIRISISIGYVTDCHTKAFESLIGQVDSLLYQAKVNGRNQIVRER